MALRDRLPFFLAYAQKPRKPTFLEYIEFDGKSYIDTGVIPSNNMEFETGVMFSLVQSTNLSVIASRDGEKRYQPIGVYQNKWSASIGSGYDANGSSVSTNTKYDLRSVVSNGDSISLYSGNTLVSSLTSSGGVPTKSLYLFARNFSPVDSYVTGRLYYCKIWDNGVLIQDLRPALDPNGKVCMYDTVTKQYFYNAGTGELKAGGRFVESIVFNGEGYVDTGIAHQTCTIECEVKFEQTTARQWQGFGLQNALYWGCRNTDHVLSIGPKTLPATISPYVRNTITLEYNTDDPSVPSETITVGNNTVTVTGSLISNDNYRLGTIGAVYPVYQEVWRHQVYIGGELAQDLRPYIDSDGVVCFKDVVTDTLFYNKGTGTLGYTEFETVEYVEFDGTKYIDTGHKPNSNSCVSVEYYPYYNRVFACIFGTQDNTNVNRFYGLISSTLYRLQVNSCKSSTAYFGISENKLVANGNGTFASKQQKVTLTIDNYNKQIKVESDELTNTYNTEVYSTTHHTPACSYSMLLGDRSTAGAPSSNKFKGQIHSCRIHESGKLVRDMIPVKRSDGTVCMYDKVENKYYELKG